MIAVAPERETREPRPPDWHALPEPEVAARLRTRPGGLTSAEARERLARYGPNEIDEARGPSRLATLVAQFRSPLVQVLIVAIVLTAVVGEYADTIVIGAVILLNAIVGYAQERGAERSVRALQALVNPHSRVVRDHEELEIESRELVPGDVVRLEAGGHAPADLRLTAVAALQVDESALTGESAPVRKEPGALPPATEFAERTNLVFMGTTIASGRGRGYVVATGRQTELGRIARSTQEASHGKTTFQERADRLARVIGAVVVGCAALTFGVGVLAGRSVTEMFLIAIAMSVSAIPEGLPIAVTIALAIGVRRMARRRAIVRRLPSVETLGSVTVVGTDKTGTLTENVMTVREIWTAEGAVSLTGARDGAPVAGDDPVDPDGPLGQTLLAGVLTNEAVIAPNGDGLNVQGDPTEAALLFAALRFGFQPGDLQRDHRVLAELPFEPEQQFSASIRDCGGERRLFVKGAPERVLAMCERGLTRNGPAPLDTRAVHDATHALADRGLRVLAMASRSLRAGTPAHEELAAPRGLTFLGLQGMADPPRPGAQEAIAACGAAGIRVVMVTGDHVTTARAIGRELGIAVNGEAVVTGSAVEAMDDDALRAAVAETGIFARVSPEQKLRIVRGLQERGHVVAVTGDGINDAPALKAADVGIAMGRRGTDVAKDAADIVLTDDNFVSIAAAVEEGRVTFDNIRRVAYFLFGTNGAEVLIILVALALGWPLPLIAAQILWLNLVTDSLPVMALAFEPGDPGVMALRPRGRSVGVLSRRLWERVIVSTVVMTAGSLALFRWELHTTGSERIAQTTMLTTMMLFQMFQALNARATRRWLFRLNPFGNPWLFLAIALSIAIHAAALYLSPTQRLLRVEPLDMSTWLWAVAVSLSIIVAVEAHKLLRRR